jgi:2-phosphosulfolactate phosphatase
MRIDVVFGPGAATPALVSGRAVAVIDVLRASTSIAAALHHGARTVIPLESADEVITRSKQLDRAEVILAGERRMLAIEGFDLGNSPLEFTKERVEGKTVLLTTTNGTAAFVGLSGAREVVVAAYANFSVVTRALRQASKQGADVTIICAGRERLFSLEDAACAGRFVKALMVRRSTPAVLGDGALACLLVDRRYGENITRLFGDAEHGRALAEAGFGEDLAACGTIDAYPVVPVYQERQITAMAPVRGR